MIYISQLKTRLSQIPLISSTKILQINVNKSASTTEHVLQMAIELDIKILAIQEPWTIASSSSNSSEFRSINHSSFRQILPNYSTFRPRAIFYISSEYSTNLVSNLP